jgi:type II secretory pathway component GspD/PulD (secretin)
MMVRADDRRQGGFQKAVRHAANAAIMAIVAGTCASVVIAQPGTVERPPGTSGAGETPATQPRVLDNRRVEQPSAEDGRDLPQPAANDQTEAELNAGLKVQDGDEIELTEFTEPVELTTLVDYVVRTLGINVSIKGNLAGSVVFNAPVKIKKTKLLGLLDALLEQQGFTITYDPLTQFYSVHPVAEVPINLQDGDASTTRIFTTPNVRPSALKAAIDANTGAGGAGMIPGQQPNQPGMRQYAYIDELGVIVATDTVRKLAQVESLIQTLLAERAKSKFIRLELTHVAAPVARDRALQLVGQGQNKGGANQDPNFILQQQQMNGQPGFGARGSFDNLQDRLTIDPQDNALIFRGLQEEIDQVKAILQVIDVASKLVPKKHNVGKAARPIAEIARQRGLGEVTQISTETSQNDPNHPFGNLNGGLTFPQDPSQQNQSQRTTTGGPVMVVDETSGVIVYYGTPEQQAALETLVTELKTDDDRVVFRTYKLKNAVADETSSIIMGLLNNQMPEIRDTSNSSSDDESSSSRTFSTASRSSNSLFNDSTSNRQRSRFRPQAGVTEEGLAVSNVEEIFIVPDQSRNQLIVKAPIRDHEAIARLITQIDLRRPQVYIEAKIVVVNWSDDLRLAFETQLINAGGTGGVLNTNFGLGTVPAGFTGPKTVSSGLQGLTAAVIKSDQVPIVMNALQTEVEGRILSSPQLLVDDNEEATIDSKDQQPTTATTLGTGGSQNTVTFDGYVDAGTLLKVTPRISDGGYIRLAYEINMSSFTGNGSAGVPPPKQDNTLKADSVTIPSDATVVLGGLTFDSESETSRGIPILKDIPLVGLLFQDLSKVKRKTTLYVFLTPKVMRDANFADQLLMQAGPQNAVGITDGMPDLAPSYIDAFERPLTVPPPLPPAPDSAPAGTQDPLLPRDNPSTTREGSVQGSTQR